ncbi:hypothetical protein L1887_09183 [Cichorium endivia]|nr:hypothetical protein L1887_09183 [Cichorium endivia]
MKRKGEGNRTTSATNVQTSTITPDLYVKSHYINGLVSEIALLTSDMTRSECFFFHTPDLRVSMVFNATTGERGVVLFNETRKTTRWRNGDEANAGGGDLSSVVHLMLRVFEFLLG